MKKAPLKPRRAKQQAAPQPIDDTASPAELFEENATARRALDQITQKSAEVIYDLESKGPLFHFVLQLREEAVKGLIGLATTDPSDTKAIFELQTLVRAYLAACEFVHDTVEQGEDADAEIMETYGHGRFRDDA